MFKFSFLIILICGVRAKKYASWNDSCDPKCETCKQNICKQCVPGYSLDNGKCVSLGISCINKTACDGCIDHHFIDDENACVPCINNCKKCFAKNSCSECFPRYYLDTDKCEQCIANCKHCHTATRCRKCDNGFLLYGGQCNQCVYGKYKYEQIIQENNRFKNEALCKDCPDNCTECKSTTNCLHCKTGFFGMYCQHNCSRCNDERCSKDGCTNGCLDGYFVEDNRGCSPCTGCQGDLCESLTGRCINGCKDGNYLENNKCYICQDCKTCSSFGKCDTCQIGKWGNKCESKCSLNCIDSICDIKTGVCENECEFGKYLGSNNTCYHCPDYCSTCDSNDSCTTCIDGRSGIVCEDLCDEHCTTCSFFIKASCITCDEGYYYDSEKQMCYPCYNKCSSCNGPNENQCSSCYDKYFIESCVCIDCDVGCLSCLSESFCTSCVPGYFLSSDKCYRCPENCASCSTNKTCTKCDARFFGTTCSEHCLEHCHTCNTSVNCVTCEDGRFSNDDGVTDNMCECSVHECSRTGHTCEACNTTDWFPQQSGCCPCQASNGSVSGLDKCLKGRNSWLGVTETNDDEQEDVPWLLIGGTVVGVVFGLFIVTGVILYVRLERKRKNKSKNATTNQSSRERIYENVNLSAQNSIAIPHSDQNDSNIVDLHLPVVSTVEDRKNRDVPSVAVVDIENHYYNMCTIQENRTVRVEQLQEYVTNMSKDQYKKDFLELPQGLVLPYVYALQNRSKCRYDKIFPYDETRVVLLDGECDFINANYINGYNKAKAYIASSGPTKKTMGDFIDFWRMIWQENVEKIVMLTHLVEKKVMKCEQYWPKPGCSTMYGDVTVMCHSQDAYADYTIRVFYIAKGTDTRSIHHLHYTSWPDKRVPDDVTSLVEFRHKVQSISCITDGPIVVHCSAGIGRTGTYIAMDILIHQAISDGYLNIYGCVEWLRRQRVRLVQTEEQYIYLHYVLVHALVIEAPTIRAEDFHVVMDNVDEIYTEFMKLSETAKLLRFKETTTPDTIPVDEMELLSDIGNRSISFKHRPSQMMKREQETSDENVMYIDSFKCKRRYLLSSTPIDDTIYSFLHLVIGTSSTCVVSMDASKGNKMFDTFLPTLHKCYTYGVVHLTCTQEIEKMSFSARTIKIQTSELQEERSAMFYQFKHWNENITVPTDAIGFVEFIKEVEENVTVNTSQHPIILHCNSNGEISGLFCTVSILIQNLEIEHEVSVNNLVTQLKAKREELIPNKEQYLFCYKCINAYIESFSLYSNFT